MSDTPRTDAHFDRLDDYWQHDVDFARTLERELNVANAELAKYKEVCADPAAVWVNMLRGTIAKPGAISALEDERSELLQKVQQLERDNARLIALATEATSAT